MRGCLNGGSTFATSILGIGMGIGMDFGSQDASIGFKGSEQGGLIDRRLEFLHTRGRGWDNQKVEEVRDNSQE